MEHDYALFEPYPFVVGQKIRIRNSRRGGDWEIVAVGEHTITLHCPITHKEYEWNKFCYLVSEQQKGVWPEP